MPSRQVISRILAAAAVVLSAVWVVVFLWHFFAQDLPNNTRDPESPITRRDVWQYIFINATTILNPFDYSMDKQAAGWSYFGQRLPFIAAAFVLLLAAWLIGRAAIGLVSSLRSPLLSERLVLEFGTGLSLHTLWILGCGLSGWQNRFALLAPTVVAAVWLLLGRFQARLTPEQLHVPLTSAARPLSKSWRIVWLCILTPFVLHIFLGGMTPPRDFDVREYHLQGPKEWFQSGHIETLPHNVYTSFPFLSEMISLGGMVLTDDWWEGAIVGKLSLTSFQFLSALCVYAIGRRWAGVVPGLLAALSFLSTPWTVRISIIAYAEGAISFYLIASIMTALLAAECSNVRQRIQLIGITGLFCGSAMASKYPGLVSVIAPVSLFFFVVCLKLKRDKTSPESWNTFFRSVAYFVVGISIAVGPWLLKNLAATGNPVYPLGYRVFGANDWSPAMDAKWKAAHSAPDHDVARIPVHLHDVAVRNDWQNGLLFALAVPAILLALRYVQVRWLWLYAFWMLGTWWALTHRIDRFWVPVVPVLAVLAGFSWTLSRHVAWRIFVSATVLVGCTFNYGFARLPFVGFHGGLIELAELKKMPIRQDILRLNKTLPKDARVLMVGEAEVFDAEFDLIYNTVFDDSIFQQLTSADTSQLDEAQPMKTAADIADALRERKITHVYVNWSEILRYRLTYGYTKYVTPEKFHILQKAGILGEPQVLTAVAVKDLRPDQQTQILSWPGNESLDAPSAYWNNMLIYPVR